MRSGSRDRVYTPLVRSLTFSAMEAVRKIPFLVEVTEATVDVLREQLKFLGYQIVICLSSVNFP